MKLPIQHALTWPNRLPCPAAKLDLSRAMSLDFEPPDVEKFPALTLGHEVARAGGTSGAVFNAANEAAVVLFLERKIGFTDIVSACRAVLENHDYDPRPSLSQLHKLDRWARQEAIKWNCTSSQARRLKAR